MTFWEPCMENGLCPQEKPLIGAARGDSDPRRQEGRKPGIIVLPNSKTLQKGSFWVWQCVQKQEDST